MSESFALSYISFHGTISAGFPVSSAQWPVFAVFALLFVFGHPGPGAVQHHGVAEEMVEEGIEKAIEELEVESGYFLVVLSHLLESRQACMESFSLRLKL